MKKLFGLLSTSLLVGLMSLGLVNKADHKAEESPKNDVLEVKDVLRMGEADGSGRTLKKVAAPAAEYVMSQAKVQVTTPDSDGTVDVRFVAAIDSFDYDAARFTIEMFDGNTSKGKITREVTKAYTAIQVGEDILAPNEAFEDDENAGSFNYLVAYTLTDMPRDVWEYGFKVTTGLKKVADELFTEELTDEVKVVKTAIMEDNHLVFTWKPYNGNYATLTWENDFVAGDVSDLDPSVEDYGNLVTEVVKEKVTVEITTADNEVVYNNRSNTHCSGSANVTHAVNVGFINGFQTEGHEYTVKATIELVDGTVLTGLRRYERLANVANAKVTENEEGKFILTFDNVANAEAYSYRIFNDSYEGRMIDLISGDELATSALDAGTYNIEIVATSDFYMESSVVFENALVIEKTAEILDGNAAFDFAVYHTGGAWEVLYTIKEKDAADKIKGITETTLKRINLNSGAINEPTIEFVNYGLNGFNASKEPTYNNDHFVFGLKVNGTNPTLEYIFEMNFIIETEAGNLYSVSLYYVAEEALSVSGTTKAETFKNLLISDFSKISPTDYDATAWNTITDLYDAALLSFDTVAEEEAYALYKTSIEAINAVEGSVKQLTWKLETVQSGGPEGDSGDKQAASNAFDGNANSRWETQSTDEHWISISLNTLCSVKRLEIKWEGASAKTYDILVSTDDGASWNLVESVTDTRGARTDTIEFATPVQANAIRFNCHTRTTGYGFSIFEVVAYGAELTA